MLAKLLTSRFAGPLLLVLAALSVAGGLFGAIQTYRLGNAKELAESRKQTIAGLEERVRSDATLISQRDQLIAKQNAGVDALVKAASANREVYLQGYARADERAKSNDARAKQLMSLSDTFADERAQCLAARLLLEEELTQ